MTNKKTDPEANIGDVYVRLGSDTEQYGAGKIILMQGKGAVRLTYVDYLAIKEFVEENKEHCNKQIEAERAKFAAFKATF